MQVFKFGGTSLGSPERMRQVAQIITSTSDQKIVVLSAVSGTTNELVSICESFSAGKQTEARNKYLNLKDKYLDFVDTFYSTEKGQVKGRGLIEGLFGKIENFISQPYNEKAGKLILAQGEIISTNLFQNYLEEADIKSALINALDFMYLDEDQEPNLQLIGKKLSPILSKLGKMPIIITQGYICRTHLGVVDNLQRGGSDYTATLIGGAVNADEVQIWTDIDGVHNNDPRIVENTMPIDELSFEEAGELAYFGAKILHPSCIIPAQQQNVPVRIKNTLKPDAKGTFITSKKNPDKVKAIAVKDGITAIKIKSTRMVNAYGFLRKIFEVFEKYQTSIDMITTSEIAVSLSIDDPTHLNTIIDELKPFGLIEVDKDQSIICIVGDFVSERKGIATTIFASLESIPVRMISYGGSKNNITVLIDTNYKKEALRGLSKGLFQQ